jgi:hypothetical protein
VLGCDIEQGYHGDTKLDDLKFAGIVSWPGAIHQGHGQVQPIVDERAAPAQREAILRILSGFDTEPGATTQSLLRLTLTWTWRVAEQHLKCQRSLRLVASRSAIR